MFSCQEKIMGTDIEILIPKDHDFDQAKAQFASQKVFMEFHRLEQVFSRFREDSELSLLNKNRSMEVSSEFLEVLEFALGMANITNGIFNPLVRLASLGYSQDFWSQHFEKTVADKINLDFRDIKIEKKLSTVHLPPHALLDLGGCVKGFTVDTAVSVMDEYFSDFVINAGGDLFARGLFYGEPWSIGIANPENEAENIFVIKAEDSAIATSGSYRRKWNIAQNQYHHLVSGTTNQNPENSPKSVTVTNASALMADTYATIALLLGKEEGQAFLFQHDSMGYFV